MSAGDVVAGSGRYAALGMNGHELLVAERRVRLLEPAADLSPPDTGVRACGQVALEGHMWPVYALDAALMQGSDRAAGAVGAMTAALHPIDVCLSLLEEGRHILLVGEGADLRARKLQLPPLPPPPEDKRELWQRLLREKQGAQLTDLATVGRPDDEGVSALTSSNVPEEEPSPAMSLLERMEQQLAKAIQDEDYEKAARLRDEIAQMKHK